MITPGTVSMNLARAQNRAVGEFIRAHRPLRGGRRDANHAILPARHYDRRKLDGSGVRVR